MKRLTLGAIETERLAILRRTCIDKERMIELNTQRKNIIMSQED